MMKRIQLGLIAAMTMLLIACGGGGDGSGPIPEGTPNFAGNYQMSTLTLSSNTCGGSPDASIAGGPDTVIQNGRTVTTADGKLSGSVDSDNGGYTFSKSEVVDGVTVITTIKMRLTATGAATFNVTLSAAGSLGIASCSITYTGTATKV